MIILDTDTVTHYSFANQNLLKRLDAFQTANPDEQLAVTIVTYYEVLQGRGASLLKAENGPALETAMIRFRQTFAMLEDDFVIVDVDTVASGHFDKLRTQKKLKMKRGDMLIACIALAQNALLVTRNIKDYKSVAGLRVENWVD